MSTETRLKIRVFISRCQQHGRRAARISRAPLLAVTVCIAVAGIGLAACKDKSGAKKKGEPVVVSALAGDVQVIHAKEKARPAKHLEELNEGDTIFVGKKSFAALQYGSDMVIKLSPNTKMRVSTIGSQSQVYLDQGKLFSKVSKLKKGDSFSVKTKTSIAAVRGTEFLVNYAGSGGTFVTVGEGKVAVALVAGEGDKVAKEEMVDAGKTAVVEKTIIVRPVSIEEKKDIVTFSDVEVIKDDGTLKNVEKVYKEVSVAPEIKIEEDTTPITGVTPTAHTAKSVYTNKEDVTVLYSNLPDSRYVWISIDKAGSPPGRQETYNWTYGYKQGSMTFPGGFAPGNYEVRVHFSRGHAVNLTSGFQVVEGEGEAK